MANPSSSNSKKRLRRLIILALFVAASLAPTAAGSQTGRYVCAPCGLPCDSKFFDKPGTCPSCGLPLVTEDAAKAGIDGALHVIELLMGKGTAQQTSLVEEYDREANSRFVRASLADKMIPSLYLSEEYGTWDIISTEGGKDHWELALGGKSGKTAAELIDHVDKDFGTKAQWTKVSGWTQGTSHWSLKATDGKVWTGTVTVRETSRENHQFVLKVKVSSGGQHS